MTQELVKDMKGRRQKGEWREDEDHSTMTALCTHHKQNRWLQWLNGKSQCCISSCSESTLCI